MELLCLSQINKLHLCKPLIRAIDSSNLKDDYSTAQRVTYKYYVGRKAMFDSDFKQGGTLQVHDSYDDDDDDVRSVMKNTCLLCVQLRSICRSPSHTAIAPVRGTRGLSSSTCCPSRCCWYEHVFLTI